MYWKTSPTARAKEVYGAEFMAKSWPCLVMHPPSSVMGEMFCDSKQFAEIGQLQLRGRQAGRVANLYHRRRSEKLMGPIPSESD